MWAVTGKTFSSELPLTPPPQVLAECYAAFERSADLDVDFSLAEGRLVTEAHTAEATRRLRPSEVFDLLD